MTTTNIRLGDYNTLRILRFTDHGAYLDGGEVEDILMPKVYVTSDMQVDDEVRVFVYLDQQERIVATTETPFIRVGQFGYLTVSWVNEYGAFLDWGLLKDLFVPFSQQKQKMIKDHSYIVYATVDPKSHRIVGTAKVDKFLQPADPELYYKGKEVEVLVRNKTPLGYKVIVDNLCDGLIYDDQVYASLTTGDRITATVIKVRNDGKLDLSQQRIGKGRFKDFADELFVRLQEAGGTLPFSDRSDADDIREEFGVSKKTFKRAVGTLYKARKIEIESDEIKIINK